MKNKIFLVGEAWGEQESYAKKPFVGPSGHELRTWLSAANISYAQCAVSNVFNFQPPGNKIDALCGSRKEMTDAYGTEYPFPQFGQGKWLDFKYAPEIERLLCEIEEVQPNLIVTLGATPLWALTSTAGITSKRGTVTECFPVLRQIRRSDGLPFKLLPTFHPAHILRNWNLRTVALADILKASKEQHHPDIRAPKRSILIRPTKTELEQFEHSLKQDSILSIDVETNRKGQITCVGLAPSPHYAVVIPLWDKSKPDWSYWTFEDEVWVHLWLKRVLESNKTIKLLQNGMYDYQYFQSHGIHMARYTEDTMHMHHAMYPEMRKGLGFLASIYTNSPEWKSMRKSNKRED